MSQSLSYSILPTPTAPVLLKSSRGLTWWMHAAVFLLAAAVYANSLKNGFAFDDVGVIRDNPKVVNLEWTAIWTENYWPTNDGIPPDALYRPVTLWSYLANQYFTPGKPFAFHLVNVVLHALVSVMVGCLTWRLLGDRMVAFVVGLLFAVHPLHTEAVANTVGRAELLATFWGLLALSIHLPRHALTEDLPGERTLGRNVLAATCFLIAILCKETPVALLPAFVFIDAWRWFRWPRPSRPSYFRWMGGQFLRSYLLMALFLAGYLLARHNACGLMTEANSIHPIVNMLMQATVAERLITPFELLTRYLSLTFWPSVLSADYSAPSITPHANPLKPLALIGILLCILAPIISIRSWKRAPQILLILGLFFLSYALVANFLRIGTIFGERLFYWPSAFILMLTGWAGVRLFRQVEAHKALAARVSASLVLVAALGAMSVRTWVRNTDWEDNLPLAIATGRDNPGSAKACFWAGTVLVWTKEPKYIEYGRELFDEALRLYPRYAGPQWEIAKFHGRRNELGPSLLHLARAVRLEPGMAMSRQAQPAILDDLRRAEPSTYMPYLEQAVKENPEEDAAHFALAIAYRAQKKYDLAEAEALEALHLGGGLRADGSDQFHEAAAQLATIRFESGKIADGLALFRQYVVRVRKSMAARCDMAQLLLTLDTKEYPFALSEAEMNLGKAALLDPASPRIRDLRLALNRKRSGTSMTASAVDVGPPLDIGPAAPAPEGAKP